MTLVRSLIVALVALTFALPARAQERILSFVSDVKVERNGDLSVTETIRVRAEGREIRRGILRDFPTVYARGDGTRVEVGFEVQAVQRDGASENFVTERLSNGVRIRIGRAETNLATGEHTYVIAYRTTRQIGYFSDYDELYWNATGTGWTFAIDVAEARITLPQGVAFRQSAIYTGPQGARDRDATVISQEPGRIVFRTTKPLPPKSGLTVAAAWPKGVIAEPGAGDRALWWITDNAVLLVAGGGTALLLLYYAFAWMIVGRDPRRGTIIPLFSPPDGMTAAGVRYVREMGFDDRTFAAALVDLGVRGHLKIAASGGAYSLAKRKGGKDVPTPEQAMESRLFVDRGTLLLEQANHERISNAKAALQKGLKEAYVGTLFNANHGWAGVGALAWFALAGAIILTVFVFQGSDLGGNTVFGFLFAAPAVSAGTAFLQSAIKGRVGLLAAVISSMFILAFGGAGILAMVAIRDGWMDALALLAPLAVLPVVVLGFSWLEAPTRAGREVMDQIEGLRMYLGTAEEERLEFLNPPDKTPETFERFLPYAIALDVENTWAARFAGVLAAAGAAAAVATWYSDNRDFAGNPTGMVERLGSSLSERVAAASTAPGSSGGSSSSSSSGSSGGGSSGGGGGGGGGSGW